MNDSEASAALGAVVGQWRLTMTTHDEGKVTRADGLRAAKGWICGKRYIEETIAGDFAGESHEKRTLLGYNKTRDRFEYVTADNHDGVILLYTTPPAAAGDGRTITLFTDYAMPNVLDAKRPTLIVIKTVLTVTSHEQHALTNSYRFARGEEELFLEYLYERIG